MGATARRWRAAVRRHRELTRLPPDDVRTAPGFTRSIGIAAVAVGAGLGWLPHAAAYVLIGVGAVIAVGAVRRVAWRKARHAKRR